MREYYPKYSELPKDIYNQVKAILQGYDRLKKERLNVLYGTPKREEGRASGSVGDPTSMKAVKLAAIDAKLEAIDQAAVVMRAKYSAKTLEGFDPIKAFWSYDYFNYQHIRTKTKPDGPCKRTWNYYKYRLAAEIAKNLKLF